QLPWEALPELEDCLARTVSLSHWLKQGRDGEADRDAWVLSTGHLHEHWRERLSCARPEAEWVAARWKTDAEFPERPLAAAEAMHKLSGSRWVHITAHGDYRPHAPTASGLSLGGSKEADWLPVWACAALPLSAELLVLSACESNLCGHDTQNLLSPAGLGPGLAAAGAQAVLGTLWSADDLAGLVFVYHWFSVQDEQPDWPLYRVTRAARQRMRQMTADELQRVLAEQFHCTINPNAADADENTKDHHGQCRQRAKRHLIDTGDAPPFAEPMYWAGFHII
ncbi:MAG: CHAT domain-containing protein, partial [Gammaproteobacteria bacterium]|nr:CHAT domain-containing protein [Gammaproteobacteria bacterium]